MKIRVMPLGAEVEAAPGQALQDVLFSLGVEFPCGGRGRCKGCRIQVLEGSLAPQAADYEAFTLRSCAMAGGSAAERASRDLVVQVRQWDTLVLYDNTLWRSIRKRAWGSRSISAPRPWWRSCWTWRPARCAPFAPA